MNQRGGRFESKSVSTHFNVVFTFIGCVETKCTHDIIHDGENKHKYVVRVWEINARVLTSLR